jgi:predicted DNA-binding transcriptional regulator AlpA
MTSTDHKRLPTNRLWTIEEVSYFLGIPIATLYYWRTRREGPACSRVGRHLRYRIEDVTTWVEQHRSRF